MSSYSLALGEKERTRILQREEVHAGRLLMQTSRVFFGDRAKYAGVSFYAYIRGVEDQVDNGREPKTAGVQIANQIKETKELAKTGEIGDPSDKELSRLLVQGVQGLKGETRGRVLHNILEMLGGIAIDNRVILSGKPLPQEVLNKRNLLESMSGFDLLSHVFWDKPLQGKGKPKVESLFNTWIRYDALRDLKEDLEAGIILFSQEELEKTGVNIKKWSKIPGGMRTLFQQEKQTVLKRLPREAAAIRETTIPEPWKTLAWAYFFTRQYKLANTEYPLDGAQVVLGQNQL